MKGLVIYHQTSQIASVPTYTNAVGDCLGYSTEETLKSLEVLLCSKKISAHITLCHLQWIDVMPLGFKLKTPPKREIKQSLLMSLTFNNEKS